MKLHIVFFYLSFTTFLSSCKKEPTQIFPDEISPFVNSFFEEAQKKGIDINLEDYDISIVIKDIDNPNHAGTCNSRANEIEIDKNYWEQSDYEHQEWLIFHELGHCLLNRSHRNEHSFDFECLSFMKGGKDDDFDCSINLYSTLWRAYYIDELFNEAQTLPSWNIQRQYWIDNLTGQNILVDTLITNTEYYEVLDILPEQNFLLEISFTNWESKSEAVGLSWDNFNLLFCKDCTENNIKITKSDKIIYQNNSFPDNDEFKISILRTDDLYSFIFCDKVIHTVEFHEWQNSLLNSRPFDEPIDMKIRISLLN